MKMGEPQAAAPSALLDAIFANAPVGLGFWDSELRFQRLNEALAAMIGLPVDEILGRRLPDILGSLGFEQQEVVKRVLAERDPVVDLVVRGETPAAPGVEREWLSSYYPVLAPDGELLGAAVIVREVTDLRMEEQEQQRLLKDALTARAQAEAARVRAESAHGQAERSRARTAFIAEAGVRMSTSLDTERALGELAAFAVPAVADWCVIELVGGGGWLEPVAVAHADPARVESLWELARARRQHIDGSGPRADVIRTTRPDLRSVVDDEELERLAEAPAHVEPLRRLGIGSALTVALKAPDRRIGTITLVHGDSGRTFGDEDVAMARALASRAALHVENARLYTEISHIARTLQAGLLPAELPDIGGVELAVCYRPAGDQNHVGGDFYDVFAIGDGAYTAVVGDVSGKGAEAAALTALTRHTLFAGALSGGDGVASLLLLNQALLRRGVGASSFCTAVTALVEPRDDGSVFVCLANGGHPAPLVLRADGRVEETTARGTLIGAVERPRFAAQDLVLRAGDVLLLYTDGVTELRTGDPADGERRLDATLAGLRAPSAQEVVDAVERSVVEATGGEPRDDVALLAIRAL